MRDKNFYLTLITLAACGGSSSGDDSMPDASMPTIDAPCSGSTCTPDLDASMTPGGCDPLADNDFDGPGAQLTKSGTTCTGTQGCYGWPSFKTTPTTWACQDDIHYSLSFRHRSPCTEANGCAAVGPTIYANSCNQGYIPLIRESTMVSTTTCVAMCKPGNTYSGNPNAQAPIGVAPHQCNMTDARGTFNTAANGDQCMFSWYFEIDSTTKAFLPSATSDTLGFCIDHSKYLYDSDGNGSLDTPWPMCTSLPLSGTGAKAGDFGCVAHGLAGIPRVVLEGPRVLYTSKVKP